MLLKGGAEGEDAPGETDGLEPVKRRARGCP